jgi:hypothetical protein
MTALFATDAELSPGGSLHWRLARDGDPTALAMYERHYSARAYADGRDRRLFVGPGEKVVLVAHDDRAMFVWRRFISLDAQDGVSCSVFRNEGPALSSTLIREADAIADARWSAETRHYTYVAPSRIRSSNPGCCFKAAGWRPAGWTKGGHGRERLLVLERVQITNHLDTQETR